MTMHPGSFAFKARAVFVERGTPARPIRSPDIKSPTAAVMLGAVVERARERNQAAARPSAEPAVPGAGGESPVPRPVASSVTAGESLNARRTSAVDTRLPAREDDSVLIVFESRPESIIALSPRSRDAHGVGSASRPDSEKGEDMSSVKSTEKWRAVETALTQIERQFGKGSIMRLGDQPEQVMSVIPTGSLAVDAALGVGGIPRGRAA